MSWNIKTPGDYINGPLTVVGDVTIGSNAFKIDSVNNRVGVNTATTSTGGGQMVVEHANNNGLVINSTGGSPTIYLRNTADANPAKLFFSDNGLTFANVTNGTLATLNSTGLGVGTSPSYKFHVLSSNFAIASFQRSGAGGAAEIQITNGSNTTWAIRNGVNDLTLRYEGTPTVTFGATGNVAIGGTPQAWNTSYKGVQVGLGANFYTNAGTPNNGWFATNTYQDASNQTTFIGTGYGLHYRHLFGEHAWLTSTVSGSAGVPATMNQLMTLDASGNLLIKKTASGGTTLGVELLANGQINGATANQDNLNIYNTTATAYRFYVNAAGTVFATNTTISAISDARFKENVQDIDVGLGAILALKPRKFDWKDGKGKNIKGDRGFIAQEFETVFPNLIDEWKENAPEGEAPYKSVRQDLIPVLVKAIQELTARVQTLENA